jgi:SET domain-containing protein
MAKTKTRSGNSTRSSAKTKRKSPTQSAAPRGIHARYPWKEEPNPYIEVRQSAIQGKGAFAARNIKKGTRLIEYLGQRISWRTADKRYDDDKMGRHHTFLFTVDDKTVIDAAVNGNDARFLNHSCDGNCEAITDRKRIFLEARKSIKAGEELLYDYQYERTEDHTAEDENFYACRCGSPKCRGSILAPKPTKSTKR